MSTNQRTQYIPIILTLIGISVMLMFITDVQNATTRVYDTEEFTATFSSASLSNTSINVYTSTSNYSKMDPLLLTNGLQGSYSLINNSFRDYSDNIRTSTGYTLNSTNQTLCFHAYDNISLSVEFIVPRLKYDSAWNRSFYLKFSNSTTANSTIPETYSLLYNDTNSEFSVRFLVTYNLTGVEVETYDMDNTLLTNYTVNYTTAIVSFADVSILLLNTNGTAAYNYASVSDLAFHTSKPTSLTNFYKKFVATTFSVATSTQYLFNLTSSNIIAFNVTNNDMSYSWFKTHSKLTVGTKIVHNPQATNVTLETLNGYIDGNSSIALLMFSPFNETHTYDFTIGFTYYNSVDSADYTPITTVLLTSIIFIAIAMSSLKYFKKNN